MRKKLLSLAMLVGLLSSTGCVVYTPRPYPYAAYEVYDGPTVVYYHEAYCGGYYYHRHCWR
jgi:hypothetical protein